MAARLTLEDIALGEVSLEEGASTIRAALNKVDDDNSYEIYAALRSWTWKTLHARRLDDELNGWMSVFSAVSGKLAKRSPDLGTKIECLMELLHASLMLAASSENQIFTERKHVKEALRWIHLRGGEVRRTDLMSALGLKAPNLSRIMAPLLDSGYLAREVSGREVCYRLTERGRTKLIPQILGDVDADPRVLTYVPDVLGLIPHGALMTMESGPEKDFPRFMYSFAQIPENDEADFDFRHSYLSAPLPHVTGRASKAKLAVGG